MSAPRTRERRRSPRLRVSREAHLSVSLAMLDPSGGEEEGQTPLTFFGSTRDISVTGFAVVVPYLNLAGHHVGARRKSMPVTLYLPAAQVRVSAIPVRVEPLDADDPGEGCLIGVEVTELDEAGRALLEPYVRGLEER